MENAEEVLHFLEEFSKRKPKTIPQELNDYLAYVARTGDPVYQWSIVKSLFKEKLLNVITDFYETNPGIEIPPYPNVDPFNYDLMKNSLIEKLDSFNSAPFTVQRICELLTYPRKQYNRIDKFMRAIEKNILVVSTREPGHQRHPEPENGEPIVNGSDNNSEYNVDVEMEDMSWKDNSDSRVNSEPQPSSSDAHISVDDLEARLHSKEESSMDTQTKVSPQYESVTPPELNVSETNEDPVQRTKELPLTVVASTSNEDAKNNNSTPIIEESTDIKTDVEMKCDEPIQTMIIPEIKVDDAEMTELKLREQSKTSDPLEEDIKNQNVETATSHISTDESSSDSNSKEEIEVKHVSEISSSEESSSSSDNTDGNSNSPKDEENVDVQGEQSSDTKLIEIEETEVTQTEQTREASPPVIEEKTSPVKIQSDNYSISDVKSELPQIPLDDKAEEVEECNKKESENENENVKEETKEDNSTTNVEVVENVENVENVET